MYRGNKLVLRRIVEAVTIGRDPGCKVVIEDEHASRHHCTIQRRYNHFVLADKSTNGTFVQVEGEEEIASARRNDAAQEGLDLVRAAAQLGRRVARVRLRLNSGSDPERKFGVGPQTC